MRDALVGQLVDRVHFFHGERDRRRVEPHVGVAVALDERSRVPGIRLLVEDAGGVRVEHGVVGDGFVRRQPDHAALAIFVAHLADEVDHVLAAGGRISPDGTFVELLAGGGRVSPPRTSVESLPDTRFVDRGPRRRDAITGGGIAHRRRRGGCGGPLIGCAVDQASIGERLDRTPGRRAVPTNSRGTI
jgi:hypothetical protein